jgi:hypothetical protein
VLFLVEQDIGALPVEILKLFGANGPEEDDARDDDEQDGDGDKDEDDVQKSPSSLRLRFQLNQILMITWCGFG